MKFIVNGHDLTPITGELTDFRGEILLPLNFLESLRASGFEVSKTATAFQVNFKPDALLQLLNAGTNPSLEIEANAGVDANGEFKGKVQAHLGDVGTVSIDQDKKIEASVRFKF